MPIARLCAVLIAALLLTAGSAAAQTAPWPAPGGFQRPVQQPQEPPCLKDFTALRDATEKRIQAVQAASKRKVAPQEGCRLFKSLMTTDAKLVKFTQENDRSCGIPPQIVEQLKQRHGQFKKTRDQVCRLAAQPAHPAGPSLSDALGTSRLPDSSNIKAGRGGTFDTLTGTALGKQ